MKLRTLVASFSANFDDLVRKIENHEAVADCVIQDIRESAAKIRGQLNISQARASKQQLKEKHLESECRRWRDRALACRESDEEKALRCMQALKQSQRSLENLRLQISENQNLIADLETHLFNVEQKLSEIQNKRESLSARSARNKVETTALQNLNLESNEGVFERWETQVVADEYRRPGSATGYSSASDQLSREFQLKEDRASLLEELAALEAPSQYESARGINDEKA